MAEFGKRRPASVYNEEDWEIAVPRERYERLMQWLRSHGPDEWHGCASTWNYGHGDAPLAWICMQESCDAATAQDVFWQCNGAEHFEDGRILRFDNPDHFDGGFKLARLIAMRWQDGLYQRRTLRLSQSRFSQIEDDHRRYRGYVAGYDVGRLPWRAPTPEQSTDGHIVDEQFFVEGFPRTLSRDTEESRRLYLSSLSSTLHWSAKWGWELPPYWFGEKLGWINRSEIPAFRG